MTDREKAIVMAYTGVTMLNGDKFDIFHRYVEEKLGRPVLEDEFGLDFIDEIKKAAEEDFLKLCDQQEDDTFYVVTSGEYSDYHICGVTRNKEYAEFLRQVYDSRRDPSDIETFIDESENGPIPKLKKVWEVIIGEYNPPMATFERSVDANEPVDPKAWLYPNGDFQIYVVADDEDHAIKIAQDKRAEYMAERKLELNEY